MLERHRMSYGWVWMLIAMGCGGATQQREPRQVEKPLADVEFEGDLQHVEKAEPKNPKMRVIHAVADSSAGAVALFLDDEQSPTAASLPFKSATEYLPISGDGARKVALRPANSDSKAETFFDGQTPKLEEGKIYTAIAYGLVSQDPKITLAAADDPDAKPSAQITRLRWFHAVPGVGPIDVCVPGEKARDPGKPLFANVDYGAFSSDGDNLQEGYANLTANVDMALQIRSHKEAVCSGRVLGIVHFKAPAASNQTAIVLASLKGKGSKRTPGSVLFCLDSPAPSPNCGETALSKR